MVGFPFGFSSTPLKRAWYRLQRKTCQIWPPAPTFRFFFSPAEFRRIPADFPARIRSCIEVKRSALRGRPSRRRRGKARSHQRRAQPLTSQRLRSASAFNGRLGPSRHDTPGIGGWPKPGGLKAPMGSLWLLSSWVLWDLLFWLGLGQVLANKQCRDCFLLRK